MAGGGQPLSNEDRGTGNSTVNQVTNDNTSADAPGTVNPDVPVSNNSSSDAISNQNGVQDSGSNSVTNNDSGNRNNSDDSDSDEEELTEASETSSGTTVPIVILDANGNLVTVTPTPTPFPYMAGVVNMNDNVKFPLKQVLIALVIVALIGTRYVLLRSRGLHGTDLVLEFVPFVSDIEEKIRHAKGTGISETSSSDKYSYANSTAARTAEAAREAQQARAEFAQAARERAAVQTATSDASYVSGQRAPVRRPSSVPSQGSSHVMRPGAETKGIKVKEGFKFVGGPSGDILSQPSSEDASLSPFKRVDNPEGTV